LFSVIRLGTTEHAVRPTTAKDITLKQVPVNSSNGRATLLQAVYRIYFEIQLYDLQTTKQESLWYAAKGGDKVLLLHCLVGATAEDFKFEKVEVRCQRIRADHFST
jgi:hypothetical protein